MLATKPLIFMSTGDLLVLCRARKASLLCATPFLYRRVELLFRIFRKESMDQDQLDNFTVLSTSTYFFTAR
ncbi:hypothetical protein PILCRDRAFT_822470 [Piloderma croceum F 1598]|uniref:Uncharacterized protein n=1 Tax=Piloderma croceum (strain F 1598) TaxID=765440 RepID=A0A0C3BSM8_PILCF|nr:hypothetical protein PILCRDRAFT_822470 [Piloderma croceum F 1598]